MVTLTMPIALWMLAALAIILGGKLLQQSGVEYARGLDWRPFALLGALLEIAVILGATLALLGQNQ